MSEFNICGVLVHARAECIDQVQISLSKMSGVEVHTATDNGRLIVTVESDERRIVADTISSFHDVKGVLSASMVYQFSDEISNNELTATGERMSA
jgi:nitrate reductase NapD